MEITFLIAFALRITDNLLIAPLARELVSTTTCCAVVVVAVMGLQA